MSGPGAEAALLLQDADGAARSLDGGMGDEPMNFSVVGTAPGVANDQANFFFRDPPAVINATFALATVTPTSSSSFTAAEVASFIAEVGPWRIVSWNFTAADSPATLSGMRIIPRRITPFGEDGQKSINVNSYLSADQFQTDRVNVPVAVTVDGYTGVMITNPSNATPASYSVAVMFKSRLDKRLEVAASPPVVMRGT